jgi:ParB-like chromosome segregation protein Spo0J
MDANIVMVPPQELLPNPYRDLSRYVLRRDKIEALRESYRKSGHWHGSIQARPSLKQLGRYEIAFGHHRVEAACLENLKEIGVVVAPRTNEDMLRMMADENSTEYQHDARVGIETIRAVVEAYGRGEIELEPPPTTPKGSHAGAQIYNLQGGKLYSLATVARFLGWVKPSDGQAKMACRIAFDGYRNEESAREALSSLKPEESSETAVQAINTAIRAAQREGERLNLTPSKVRQAEKKAADLTAQEIQKTGAAAARDNAVGFGRSAAANIAGKKKPKPQPVEFFIAKIVQRANSYKNVYQDILRDCRLLLPVMDDIHEKARESLARALRDLRDRNDQPLNDMVNALEQNDVVNLRKLLES